MGCLECFNTPVECMPLTVNQLQRLYQNIDAQLDSGEMQYNDFVNEANCVRFAINASINNSFIAHIILLNSSAMSLFRAFRPSAYAQ